MNTTFRTMLFATVMIPVGAFAQDATTPGENQMPPIVEGQQDPALQQNQGTAQQDPAMQDPALQQNQGTAQQDPAMQDPALQQNQGTAQQDPALQQQPLDQTAQQGTGGELQTFVTVPPTGAWRVADLEGKDVYGIDGEDIGEINDVIVGEDGRVIAVIVGVGGFLGIGEKDVAVAMNALKFGPGMTNEDVVAEGGTGAVATGSTDMAQQTPPVTGDTDQTGAITDADGDGVADTVTVNRQPEEGQTAMTDVEIGDDALPTRIVLNVTREQLENAPSFRGIRASNMDGGADMQRQPVQQPVQ